MCGVTGSGQPEDTIDTQVQACASKRQRMTMCGNVQTSAYQVRDSALTTMVLNPDGSFKVLAWNHNVIRPKQY